MKQVVLIGFMGAGKTTIGKLLAQETGLQQYDFDEVLVNRIGMPIADFFDLHGEEAFREIETDVLKNSSAVEGIISTGGGIVLKGRNREFLKEMPLVVYLKANLEELIHRVVLDKRNVRPLATSKSPDEIREVYLPRVPMYEESASCVIETTNRKPEEIVQEILNLVGE
ncbi:shikimate kinase [Enterococcus olivae]